MASPRRPVACTVAAARQVDNFALSARLPRLAELSFRIIIFETFTFVSIPPAARSTAQL
jgi:hypothetical protein